MAYSNGSQIICGCWYVVDYQKKYLPLVELKSHTTILATTSRTKLTQTFHNPLAKEKLDEVQYTFPLYDGVSVVSFNCRVAGRTIIGVVKEKQQARTDYLAAVDRGETAGLLEQITEASDAFTTKIGNTPANETVIVEIEYLGELKHDAETDGSRFTIPTVIAPRYGSVPAGTHSSTDARSISISVDVAVDEGSVIRGIQSPSHPIAVIMGRTSTTIDEDTFDNHHASAMLTLGDTVLEKDFIIVVLAKGQDTPRALLETHPIIPNQRALMATLVPKFNLPSIHPEIVFVVDRSGSMGGRMSTLVAALKVFLKSLPVSVKFNICSFGSHHQFMFPKSKTYDQFSLEEAIGSVESFSANLGGTEMYSAIEATVKNRLPSLPLELLVLTDGEIWKQEELFSYINTSCTGSSVRVFSLGIGSGASTSLVEGIARAGNGFAQFVDDSEKMENRVVRMLKGALSPHIKDYNLEVKYAEPSKAMNDDFEIIESIETGISKLIVQPSVAQPLPEKKPISLFDTTTKEIPTNPKVGRYDHLPAMKSPSILQAPHKVPTLYPFNRTTVYLLLGPDACQETPKSVILRATSEHGPLELEIPVQEVGLGQTIHQLAAKKAVHELEQGRGWLADDKFKNKVDGTRYEGFKDDMIEREAVRLGVQFQVGGKFCSFVAVEDGVVKDQMPEHDSVPSWQSGRSGGIFAARGPGIGFSASSSMGSVGGGGALFGASTPMSNSGGGLFAASSPINQPAASTGFSGMLRKRSSPPRAASGSTNSNKSFSFGSMRRQSPVGSSSYDMASRAPGEESFQRKSAGVGFSGMVEKISSSSWAARMHGSAEVDCEKEAAVEAKRAPVSKEEKVRALIDLNKFDGSWEMQEVLGRILGTDWNAVNRWSRDGWSDAARATAIVIAFLEVKMGKEEEVWEMVVEKAKAWLGAMVGNGNAEDGISELKRLLA